MKSPLDQAGRSGSLCAAAKHDPKSAQQHNLEQEGLYLHTLGFLGGGVSVKDASILFTCSLSCASAPFRHVGIRTLHCKHQKNPEIP
jgi:hypothetical protein